MQTKRINSKYKTFHINNDEIIKTIKKQEISTHARSFIYTFLNYLHSPTNSIIINNTYPSVSTLCKIVGVRKSKLYEILKELEENNIIRRNTENGHMIIYFNPKFFFGEDILNEIIEMFNQPKKSRNKIDKKSKEKELERYIVNNLNLIESGMRLIQNQYPVEDGFIDILTRDKNGKLCIIELKVVKNDERIVHQCVYYPTQFDEEVRVITIAPDYSKKIYSALKSLNYVEIKQYKIKNGKVIITDYNK